jgi:hypothetical protein
MVCPVPWNNNTIVYLYGFLFCSNSLLYNLNPIH